MKRAFIQYYNNIYMKNEVRVLVVDDEEDVEWLFRQQFRKEIKAGQVQFDFFFSGEDALEFMRSGGYAHVVLVLSDINMPGMTGIELLRILRKEFDNLPVHMITAYGDSRNYELAMEYGASGYLTKPLDFSEIKTTILEMNEAR